MNMNTGWYEWVDTFQRTAAFRYVAIFVGVAALGAAGWGVRQYFVIKNGQEAQKAFSEALTEFNKASQDDKEARWSDVVKAFQTGSERYGSTWAAPYMFAYQSEALVREGKTEEAIAAMAKGLKSLATSSPLYYFYATRLGLMKLDSKEQATRDSGVKDLDTIGENPKNPDRERALYYSADYAFYTGDKKKASRVWAALVERAAPESVWAPLAKRKLMLLEKAL